MSAFHLSGDSTGPRSSGDIRSEPQPRAKVQGQATTPSLSLVLVLLSDQDFGVEWTGSEKRERCVEGGLIV